MENSARALEALGHRGVVRRNKIREHFAGCGERLTADRNHVFQADRNTVERSGRLPTRTPLVGGGGLRERSRLIEGIEGMHAGSTAFVRAITACVSSTERNPAGLVASESSAMD
jgi:hypothetical protein